MNKVVLNTPIPATGRPQISSDHSFYKDLLDGLYDGVYFVDRSRAITYWNRGAERLTGYSKAEAIGRHCFDNFLHHTDEAGCALCGNSCPLLKTIEDGESREVEVYLLHKSGHRVPVVVRASPIRDGNGVIIGAVEVFSDASAKKSVEKRVGRLQRLAFQDALTGIASRRYTQLRVRQELQAVEAFDKNVGLFLLDVDYFKEVNDSYGHEAGDRVLQMLSRVLVSSLRSNDLVGRWGGEEFLIIVQEADHHLIREVAERCRAHIETTNIRGDGWRASVTASIGATLFRRTDTSRSLLKRADRLMYLSKSLGRNRVSVG